MEWIWQGLFTNWVAAVGIVLASSMLAYLNTNWVAAVGIVLDSSILVYLKVKYPKWANVALYGLGVFFLLSLSLWAFKSMAALQKNIPQVTSTTIEAHIKKWIENHELSIRRKSLLEPHIAYEIGFGNDIPIVLTLSENPQVDYLILRANIEVTQEQKAVLARVKGGQLARLIHEFNLEIAKGRVLSWPVPRDKIENVWLFRRLPINNLTEEAFIERVYEMNFAINIVQAAMLVAVDRLTTYTPQAPPPKQ